MKAAISRILTVILLGLCVLWFGAASALGGEAKPSLTFFGWSDQHVQTDGDGKHLMRAIDAMNVLPGTKYPAAIGGTVDKPAFVLGCGDITEWPTTAARDTYHELVTKRLKFPSYDILGNHDEGGRVPSQTMKNWMVARHGALSYTFDKGGVHFIMVFSAYDESLNNPAQPITKEAIDFIRGDLATTPRATPVIVVTHLCFDAMTNKDDLIESFGDATVVLVLGGHYHKAKVDRHEGFHFVQLPSPAPGSPNEFTVLRIRSNRLVAIPYDYEKHLWSDDPAKVLDMPIVIPREGGDSGTPGAE